jgi:hypothetical protein
MCDVVPVIFGVQERFGVTLPEGAWPETVGDLYLYVLGRTRRTAPDPCPTGRAFYRLRRTLADEFGVGRGRVRPATPLCALFPAASRGAAWPRLAAALGLPDLPALPRRRVPSARLFGIVLAAVTAAWWIFYPILRFVIDPGEDLPLTYGLMISFLLALTVCEGFGFAWIGGSLAYLERVRVPLVRHLVARLTLQPPDEPAGDPTPQTVWADLAAIVAAEARVPAREIHPEQRFSDLPDYC